MDCAAALPAGERSALEPPPAFLANSLAAVCEDVDREFEAAASRLRRAKALLVAPDRTQLAAFGRSSAGAAPLAGAASNASRSGELQQLEAAALAAVPRAAAPRGSRGTRSLVQALEFSRASRQLAAADGDR